MMNYAMFSENALATILSVFTGILAVVVVIFFGKFDRVVILFRGGAWFGVRLHAA